MIRSSEHPDLLPKEIHVWNVSTEVSNGQLEYFKNVLSEDELNRIPFFEFGRLRESYTVSQGALRILLSRYLDIPPKQVKIGRRRKGKPYSLDDEGLYFNISNSGNRAVFAFSRDGEVGIDMEKIRPLPDLDEMISANFTASEIRLINARPEERAVRFFRFWTVKESYLKAIGEGMRLPPNDLEFAIDNGRIRLLSVKGVHEAEDWYFQEFSPDKDHVGTIAHGRTGTAIRQIEFGAGS